MNSYREVPAGWKEARLKRFSLSIQTGPFGSQLHAEDYQRGGRPVINPANLRDGQITADDHCCIDEATFARLTQHELEEGDLVLGRRGELGRCGLVTREQKGWLCGTGSIKIRLNRELAWPNYFNWFMRLEAVADWLSLESVGTTMENLGAETVKSLPIVAPAVETQRTIAGFLDQEVTRLDALVAEKERWLELLAEKRRALITHAVTRGLNPTAPLCDSGFVWLGQIPSHWKVERSKWLVKERDERTENDEGEMLTVSHLTGVTPRSEKDVNMFEAETTEGYKICLKGDLAINTLWAWMGAMGVSPCDGIVSPAYNVYALGPELLTGYVDALVRLPLFAQEVIRHSKGVWSSRMRLYPEGLYQVWLPVPPLEEQCAIVAHISAETAKIDALRAATERTIELLKERRAALIAAAVTGKINLKKESHGD